ncbi:MAG: D-alanyl-D-alanine carboxypeptidase [Saprospiraceae bacterium]|nr:D-alanyl-D-alanine carboxypeptidase [Saprospiraceae bacterium]
MQPSAKILISLFLAGCCLFPSQVFAQKKDPLPKGLETLLTGSKVFSQGFTGFALYDPQTRAMIAQYQADKYFTPASNTKILTLQTALNVLGDSLPVLRYLSMGDYLVFWGTGNPAFLHPDLPADTTVLSFLRSRSEELFFTDFNFKDEHFGPGWSWDDFSDYYQPERSPMPIYGNVARFRTLGPDSGFVAHPALFRDSIYYGPQLEAARGSAIRRSHIGNRFEYNAAALRPGTTKEVPFDYSPALFTQLLSDTLRRPVRWIDARLLPSDTVRTLYMPANDSLYMRLMRDSDNFIAEQLLMMCSEQLFHQQNTAQTIDYAKGRFFNTVPDRLEWWDGSGLSRYNAFTPRTVVHILDRLYRQQPRERLFRIFPAGGVSGTIRDWYPGKNGQPYVFAKTGTLRYVHCLSGFVTTKKGKVLIFSFMHNNHTTGANPLKEEMQKVLRWVQEQY